MNDFQRVLDYAAAQGVDVEFAETDHVPYQDDWPTALRLQAGAKEGGKRVAFYPHVDVPEDVRVWTLLHELGHCHQWETGVLTSSRIRSAYQPFGPVTEETVDIEVDAWQNAARLASELGITVTERARNAGRMFLGSYISGVVR